LSDAPTDDSHGHAGRRKERGGVRSLRPMQTSPSIPTPKQTAAKIKAPPAFREKTPVVLIKTRIGRVVKSRATGKRTQFIPLDIVTAFTVVPAFPADDLPP